MSGWAHRLVGLLAVLVVLSSSSLATAGDPYLVWYTIRTPHYRVHYHGGLAAQAQRVASLAELLRERLGDELAWKPRTLVHIVLTDSTDDANGFTQVLPYDAITLLVTAPDDMSELGDYDDWLLNLLTHEHTHGIHLNVVSGLPALVNAILGKTYLPNVLAPKWIAEGLAVAMESKYSSAGRLRSTQFDMYLRADVLEGYLATLDQIGNPARRWPSGSLWYLYGGKFVEWIEGVYGADVFAAVIADYGSSPIPWGVNRSIRRVTGRTYEELYAGWFDYLRDKYQAQRRRVEALGLRQGTRLTWRGRDAGSPRFVPPCARQGKTEELVYFRDDGHTTAGLYRLPLLAREKAGEPQIVARSSSTAASFDGACGLVFDSSAPSRRLYSFRDLIRQPRGTASPRGIEATRQRLTVGARARSPDVSPDGQHIAYVTNRAGTSTLRIADFDPDGRVSGERVLVPSAHNEQAFTPRFSPDGRSLAYGVWTRGGYRDVRVVDLATGRFTAVTHDRALDQQPTWSSDGRTLFFVSDRTGIANVYAFDLASRRLYQVTNVVNGAYLPEVTPDGRTLYYVGYTAAGFDLFALELDRSQWRLAAPYRNTRPDLQPEPAPRRWPVKRYSPWGTLRPHAYTLAYGQGTFGPTLTVSTSGSDVVGLHAWAASVAVEARVAEPLVSLDYAYGRLPVSLGVSFFRRAQPRRGYRYGNESPIVVERATGVSSSVSLPLPGEFDSQAISVSYSMMQFASDLPPPNRADPASLVTVLPPHGFFSDLHLGYTYSNAEVSTYAVSAEKGLVVALGSDLGAHELGSESTLQSFTAQLVGYVPLPWLEHHVLALSAAGGTSAGTYSKRGLFYTGGFFASSLLDAFRYGAMQGGFVLRGYRPAQFVGSQYNLYNAEYRFPLLFADRGVSTLPVFLRTVSAALFADFGGAFQALNREDPWDSYHLGVGAELRVDLVVGYEVGVSLRLGHGQGTDSKAPPGGQTYLVAAATF